MWKKIERMSFSAINYEIVKARRGWEKSKKKGFILFNFQIFPVPLLTSHHLLVVERDIFQRLWSTVRLFGSFLCVLFAHRHFISHIFSFVETAGIPFFDVVYWRWRCIIDAVIFFFGMWIQHVWEWPRETRDSGIYEPEHKRRPKSSTVEGNLRAN